MVRQYKPVKYWGDRRKKIGDNGYVLVYVPQHPKSFCGGFYYEHRLVVERHLGYVLESWVTVHHISENKLDNSLRNLFPCTRKQHDCAVWLTYKPC